MKLLLAIDGSDQSYEAVRALKYLARAEELHILHVLDVPTYCKVNSVHFIELWKMSLIYSQFVAN